MEATVFPVNLAQALGIIIAICAILYAVPKTAFLGAILVTGFLGGAICTHFRLGEFFYASPDRQPASRHRRLGGLYLRDPRLRQLIPLNMV